ncbi:MAG: YidC/Oxa1 family membrane protein insertase [Culicoidibacterales bacterium]
MKIQKKKIMYLFGFIGIALFLTACGNDPIVIGGGSEPNGLLDTLIVYPISWLITNIYNVTGNAGIAIAVATIVIYILISPLEIKSQIETKKQQELQPELKKLQEKYPNSKTDRVEQQKYSVAMNKVYTDNGMTMMGGCLAPLIMIVIQMPLLISMFSAVRRLTILNESTFVLFGVNYSFGLPDPGIPYIPFVGDYLKIFIILAIISIFLSSYFTLPKDQRNPKTNQQAMTMYLMNVMFIFILWNQPIALAIYWIVSNLTRLAIRLLFVNRIVEKEHAKHKDAQRKSRIK